MPGTFEPQIPFVMEHQKGDEWCWIALAVSVKHHFDTASTLQQCELAKTLLRIAGPCCTTSGSIPTRCDKPGRLEDALGDPAVNQFAPNTPVKPNPKGGGAMAFADVKAQIDNNLPVCFYIEWSPGGVGHFALISGYLDAAPRQYLYVNDPLYGSGPQPYQRVVSNYQLQGGTWTFTYRLKV